MGVPKFSRRTYDRPSHPWRTDRMKMETEMLKKFALKNKKEFWKAESYLRVVRGQARELRARVKTGEAQAKKEEQMLIRRLFNLGMIPTPDATLDDILALNVESVLSRRLSTIVYLKGLSGTIEQARQFINHGHVGINGRKVNVPGMLVTRAQEQNIGYMSGSPFVDQMHPMRPKVEFGSAPRPAVAKPEAKAAAKMPITSPQIAAEKAPAQKAAASAAAPAAPAKGA
ncbi:MAG: 30S ribosomal protein S4 [Candidatus Thermoplasmatota archaeon]|nr:30S ribosomal protein S4 [Candidatus Thermoplasmatota archaeon]